MSDLIKREDATRGEWIDTNEDVISREWILKEFDKGKPMLCQSEYFAELFWLVRHAPAVENKGEWLFKEITDDYHITGQCSVCKERRRIDNFCPNCGCRMKGADDE